MRTKINITELKIAILLIPFFTFAIGFKWPIVGFGVLLARYLFFISSLFLLIYNGKILELIKEQSFQLLLALYFILILSTYINDGKIFNSLQVSMYGLFPYVVMARYWGTAQGKKRVLGGINLAFTILIFVNLIIMLSFPEGIYSTYSSGTITKYYLFGAKNQMVAPLLIGMTFFVEYAYETFGRLNIWALVKCTICIAQFLLGGSGTGILMISVFLILILLQRKGKNRITPNISFILLVMMFGGIVLFQIQNAFSFIIEDILHKTMTLSNRTYIWEAAIFSIKQNPLLGIGVSDTLAGNVSLHLDYISIDTFAHNMYLDIAVMGGLIASAILVVYLLKIKKYYNCSIGKDENTFIWWGFWLYLVASLVEIYIGNYCMFIIAAYIVIKYRHKRI